MGDCKGSSEQGLKLPGKPKVALVVPYAPAVRMFRFQLLASLREKGCETLVLAPDWTPSLKAGVEDTIGALTEDYPLNRAGVSPLADLQTAVVLLWTFRRTRFSVVLTFQPKPNVYGILAAALNTSGHCPP